MNSLRKETGSFFRKTLRLEKLEDKRLLAIIWVNELDNNGNFDPNNGFVNSYQGDAQLAREIVNLAINDWNSVIPDFNFGDLNDANPGNGTDEEFHLTVTAGALANTSSRGQVDPANTQLNANAAPIAATVELDDNAGGNGWFFDTTPLDDIEFTGIADDFSASFIDDQAVAQNRRDDLYRTVVHEIGHALGITSNPNAAIAGMFTNLVDNNGNPVRYLGLNNQPQLRRFQSTRANPTFNVTATFNGSHIYEGSDTYLLEGFPGVLADPATVFQQGNPAPIAFQSHPNDLLNSGITVPGGVNNPENETVRQWISDLDAMILADAYGYTVTLPSQVNSAHTMLDSVTGQLLVQGVPGNDDDINITLVGGDTVRVVVDNHTEEVPLVDVSEILIAPNGTGNVTLAGELDHLRQAIDYVVSSNEDAIEAGGFGDGVVDLSAIIPGNQTTLRGAVLDARLHPGTDAIYVGRGNYQLTRGGTGGDSQGDMDISQDLTIIGAGAGQSVINATGLSDRIFEVIGTEVELNLSHVTLTGGASSGLGGAIYAHGGTTLNVSDSTLVNNSASSHAGAIYNVGVMTVTNSVVTENVSGDRGGGVRNTGTATITGSIFANDAAANEGNDLYGAFISGGNNLITDLSGTFGTLMNGQYGDFEGPANHVVTSVADIVDNGDDLWALSLREAVTEANADNGTIWVPSWQHRLGVNPVSRNEGDFDITGDVTMVGTGAGLAVINAKALEDRIFEIVGSGDVLNLSRVTLTAGSASGGGGAVNVNSGATLNLERSALVNNTASSHGGAIFNLGTLDVSYSVITNNVSTTRGGGIRNSGTGTATVTGSLLANDDSLSGEGDDVYGTFISGGNNLLTSTSFSSGFTPGGANGDFEGPAEVVVTSVADTFDHTDDVYALSLREAVDLANRNSGAEELWLPAWNFVLTRDRATYAIDDTDTDVSFGDIEIKDSLTIRGIGSANGAPETSIQWKEGIADAIFELLGDYGGLNTTDPDGVVNGDDSNWLSFQFGLIDGDYSADGNEDGDVDGDDYNILAQYFLNTLVVLNVDV